MYLVLHGLKSGNWHLSVNWSAESFKTARTIAVSVAAPGLLCLPPAFYLNAMTSFIEMMHERPPETKISSPRQPLITSKFLFEFNEIP